MMQCVVQLWLVAPGLGGVIARPVAPETTRRAAGDMGAARRPKQRSARPDSSYREVASRGRREADTPAAGEAGDGRAPGMEAPLAMDCYEDMFKEITRKLYGEDDNMAAANARPHAPTSEYEHGDGTLAAFGLAALMQNGFQSATVPQPHAPAQPDPRDRWVQSDEALPWTASKVASYNPAQRAFRCADCDSVGSLARVAEHWLGTHANLRVFQCPRCAYSSAWARCVRMHLARQHGITEDSLGPLHRESPALQEVSAIV
ncbi:uncharacterized protein LOC134527375 [Bacillus rossius redtenbacheri]|uniref:uncharacterized protein LOC134527375 n=1 Tax=Bacillus rossius redtenbacheri TaxID=93214 RepID=UPI002FDE4E47